MNKFKNMVLFILSFSSAKFLQKFRYYVYLLGLFGMGYGYGINSLGHAKKIIYRKLGYNNSNKNFIFFDVGANIGQTIEEVLDMDLGKNIIYSFEPQIYNFNILKTNFGNNKKIKLYNFGFGNENKDVKLYKEIEGDTGASIIKGEFDGEYYEKIKIETIDDFCIKNSIDYISYLKMDIEGAEYSALEGAKKTLKKGIIEAIEFEFLRKSIGSKVFLKDFWDLLSENYDFYRILPRNIYKIKEYSHLLEIFCLSNFVCVKKGSKIN